MNNFYVAKKNLGLAGYLDLICVSTWILLIFTITVYHFGYLLGGDGNYKAIAPNIESGNGTKNYAWTFINSNGYSKFFDVTLIDLLFVRITLWRVVLFLFLTTLFTLLLKIFLASFSLYWFIKAKSIQHIYASVAVLFLPLIGGIIAINVYRATTSSLAPKYIAAYSLLRFKLKKRWNDSHLNG